MHIKYFKLLACTMICCLIFGCASDNILNEKDTTVKSDAIKTQKESEFNKMQVIINDKIYSATLYKNETTEEFIKMLPLTIKMSQLNNNEKYYYLNENLPTNSKVPKSIKIGDIKLYGSNCLVLFYDNFNTSYSYTDIGSIDEPKDLKNHILSGNIEITFQLEGE